MSEHDIAIERLRALIGRSVLHQGAECRVIEVLEHEPAVVLQDTRARGIQDDQFGSPNREVPEVYTVPVLEPDCVHIHPDFRALELV